MNNINNKIHLLPVSYQNPLVLQRGVMGLDIDKCITFKNHTEVVFDDFQGESLC